MQAHISFPASGIRAERSCHRLPEYLRIAVSIIVTGSKYPDEIRINVSADEARALAEQLLSAAKVAEREAA